MDTWHVDATTAGTFRTGDGFDGMWMRPLNRRQLRDVLVAMTVVFLTAGHASVDAAAGRTELELARAIHGEKAKQQRVNQERSGAGGAVRQSRIDTGRQPIGAVTVLIGDIGALQYRGAHDSMSIPGGSYRPATPPCHFSSQRQFG